MDASKPRIRIRVVLMAFLVVLTFSTGSSIAIINFLMESKQSQEDGAKVLRLISEDINDLTIF